MTSLASPSLGHEAGRASSPGGGLLRRIDGEWSVADWIVGVTSVALAIGSASFFAISYAISVQSPDYFQKAALARIPPKLDQIQTGSVDAAANAMPAQAIVRAREPVPADYQIVMIFQDEALLATRQELMRVKVGSVVPGLGTIQAIDGTALGGTVTADKATLKSLSAPQP